MVHWYNTIYNIQNREYAWLYAWCSVFIYFVQKPKRNTEKANERASERKKRNICMNWRFVIYNELQLMKFEIFRSFFFLLFVILSQFDWFDTTLGNLRWLKYWVFCVYFFFSSLNWIHTFFIRFLVDWISILLYKLRYTII